VFNIDSEKFKSRLEKREETLEEFFTDRDTVFTIIEYSGDIAVL